MFLIIRNFVILLPMFMLMAQNHALVLNGAYVVMSGGSEASQIHLVVNQSSTDGIIRNNGHIISEAQYHYVQWNVGSNTGNFVFPFGLSTSDFTPFTFSKITSNASALKASSWSSAPDNTTWAGTSQVGAVTNMTGVGGATAVNSVIDRWWDVQATSGTMANFTFSYRGAENTTTINPTGTFQAQNWTGSTWNYSQGTGIGVTSGIGTVQVNGTSDFTPWILSTTQNALSVDQDEIQKNEPNGSDIDSEITTFPNPFEDHLSVVFKNNINQEISLRIKTPEGKLVFSQVLTIPPDLILIDDLKKLQAGIYFLSITDESQTRLCKIIKN